MPQNRSDKTFTLLCKKILLQNNLKHLCRSVKFANFKYCIKVRFTVAISNIFSKILEHPSFTTAHCNCCQNP